MPQPLSSPSWSSLHVSRTPRHPGPSKAAPSKKPNRAPYIPPSSAAAAPVMSFDLPNVPLPRAASTGGKKRPRESDPHENKAARRTRSVGGDARNASSSASKNGSSSGSSDPSFQRQLIGVWVPRALKESLEGSTNSYSELVAHFIPTSNDKPLQLPTLLPLLRALTAHVSLLDPSVHYALVTAIVQLPWATGDDRFIKSYVGFCGVLVSAHPGWAREIVAMAVKGLTWQSVKQSSGPTTVTRRTYHARHHLLLSHLLSLIPTLSTTLQTLLNKQAPHKREPEVAQTTWVRNCCELIEYCPELGARVWSSLVDRMLRIDVEITNRAEDDEDDDDDDDDEDGEGNDVAERLDPFDLLINEDVPRADGHESDDDDDSEDEEDIDPDALSSDDERESDDEEEDAAKLAEQRKRKREVLRSMRAKLDGMLMYFLGYLDESMGARAPGVSAAEQAAHDLSALSSGTSSAATTPRPGTPTTVSTPTITGMQRTPPTPAQSLAHFQTLLNLFSRQILPTSSTQHLPFVLFRCSSFSAAHTDLFLHRLVSLALYASDTPTPTPTQPVPLAHRTGAAVYIGSLVTRARFVTDEQARTVMQYLLAYVDGKLAQAQARGSAHHIGVSADELPLFYAVCQAAMLIFCFRWRALTAAACDDGGDAEVVGEMELDGADGADAGDAQQWMRDLDVLQRAITSDLNPLLGCNATIVKMFAKVAHATGFAYCFSIIEANAHAHTHTHTHALHGTGTATRATSIPNLRAAAANGGAPPNPAARRFARTTSAPALAAPSLAAPRSARQTNIDAGLDDYFPFDPYDLPRSGEYVEPLYRTWDEVAVDLGDDDDDDDEDEDDEDEDEEMEELESDDADSLAPGRIPTQNATKRTLPIAKAGSYGEHRRRNILNDAGLSTSLENMNISPAATN